MRRIRGDDGRGRGKEGGGEATRVIARLNGVAIAGAPVSRLFSDLPTEGDR